MERFPAVRYRLAVGLACCVLLMTAPGCGTGDETATEGGTTTSAESVDGPTTAGDDATTGGPASTEATPESPSSTAADGDGLSGRILEARWTDDGVTQVFLDDGMPTGLTAGTRIPVSWSGDNVSLWLGFADWSGVGLSRGAFEADWDGELLLLEAVDPAGSDELYLVRDHVPLSIPGGSGLAAAACFDGDIPHVIELRFGAAGPTVASAWSIDTAGGSLQPTDAGGLECPDFTVQSVGEGLAGAIVVPTDRYSADDDCGDLLDISGPTPLELPHREFGGCMIYGEVRGDDAALAVLNDTTQEPNVGWIQLQAFLGWDYTGRPLWRVLDAEAVPEASRLHLECRTDDGRTAVATVEGPATEPVPVEAWTVDDARREVTTIDPSRVTCEYLGD